MQTQRTTLTLAHKTPAAPVKFSALRVSTRSHMMEAGPGAYIATPAAIWVILPGIVEPVRLNVGDESVRPCYTIREDDDGNVEEILDVINLGGHVYRWRSAEITRER